ncbi:MAG: heme A synthase, partial [Flavobacteriales bacterium TMED288]
SFLTLVSMIFQAFIGATVVYSVLKPFKITIHMLIALFITSLITLNISFFKTLKIENKKTIKKFKLIVILSLIISTTQIIFGTQVRQFIDELSKSIFQNNRELWLNLVGLRFEVHRSFAILVLIVNLILVYLNYKMKLNLFKVNILFVFILIEIFTGIVMSYFGIPKLFQPLHLIFASILFTIQSSILFDFINISKSY